MAELKEKKEIRGKSTGTPKRAEKGEKRNRKRVTVHKSIALQ
jgi:hypothetical protein